MRVFLKYEAPSLNCAIITVDNTVKRAADMKTVLAD